VHTAAEQQYWCKCQKLINQNPELFEVHEGYVPDDEVATLMARHHAVILPYENFFSESGVAALALSHRRPILATSSGGLGELLQSGLTGISIEAATVEAVADAIESSIKLGPGLLSQRGIAGKKFVNEGRSWDSIARQTARVYGEFLKGDVSGLISLQGHFKSAPGATADQGANVAVGDHH
jgi:glycosyltransferase involved in cell wall biosynthesis